MYIAAGTLDGARVLKLAAHIFVADKANYYRLAASTERDSTFRRPRLARDTWVIRRGRTLLLMALRVVSRTAPVRPQLGVKRTCHGHIWIDAIDPTRKSADRAPFEPYWR